MKRGTKPWMKKLKAKNLPIIVPPTTTSPEIEEDVLEMIKGLIPEITVREIFPNLPADQVRLLCRAEKFKKLCFDYIDILKEKFKRIDIVGADVLQDLPEQFSKLIDDYYELYRSSDIDEMSEIEAMEHSITRSLLDLYNNINDELVNCEERFNSFGFRVDRTEIFGESGLLSPDKLLSKDKKNYYAFNRLIRLPSGLTVEIVPGLNIGTRKIEEMLGIETRREREEDPMLLKEKALRLYEQYIEDMKKEISEMGRMIYWQDLFGELGFIARPEHVFLCLTGRSNIGMLSVIAPYPFMPTQYIYNKKDTIDFVKNFTKALNLYGLNYDEEYNDGDIGANGDGKLLGVGRPKFSDRLIWRGKVFYGPIDYIKIGNLISENQDSMDDNPFFNKFYLSTKFVGRKSYSTDGTFGSVSDEDFDRLIEEEKIREFSYSDFMTKKEFEKAKRLYGSEIRLPKYK